MKKLLTIALILLWLPCFSAFAVKLHNLYEVRLPVMSQQQEDRMAAVQAGLLQVLIKLSGDPDIESKPAIKAALKRADYYVQEYSYEQPDTTDADYNYNLRIKFEKRDVTRLMKQSSVTYWGDKRPLILVWMVVADLNSEYKLIGSEEASDLLSAFKNESKKYGLPVIFPMMDMTDVSVITTTDVTSVNVTALNAAAKRYAPDALLIGRVIDNKQELTSEWVLIRNGNSWEWTLSNSNSEQLFGALMNQVRQTLAKSMALRLDEPLQTKLKMQVKNVAKPEDFEQLMKFVKQLVPVVQVQLAGVTGDVVDLDLQVQGTMNAFQENNVLSQRLTLMSSDESSNKLTYEWKR
jgi:hypothetical protein